MIESKIIESVELDDTIQKTYIYSHSFLIKYFSFFRIMLKYKQQTLLLIFFLKFYFYFQFMIIPIVKTPKNYSENDTLITFFKSIKEIILIHEIIDSKKSYIVLLSIVFLFSILLISLIIYLMINYDNLKIRQAPIKFLNLLNLFLLNGFLCPTINILLLSTNCKKDYHIYLNLKCYSSMIHIIIVIFSMFFLFFIVIYSLLLSIYYFEIGGIKGINSLTRINSNFETYTILLSIIAYFLIYFIQYQLDESYINYTIVINIYICLSSYFLGIYLYKRVLFYNNKINNLNYYIYPLISWYTFILIIKKILSISNSILLVIIGWLILLIFFIILKYIVMEYYLTEFNIFEAKSLKEIEMFTNHLQTIAMDNSSKSKTLLIGLIKTLNDYFENNPEITDKYQKFKTNETLINKHGGSGVLLFDVYNIIYVIYEYYLEKTELKNDILLVFCYFLSNKLKNMTYSLLLCSKSKFNSHKLMYLKFLLIEDLIEYFILKLTKKAYIKDTLKNIEIGSVIIYNTLVDKLKIKIYDASCSQIEYFDILRNNVTTTKSTETFLNLGNTILNLRKEILDIWNKIIELNPFSDEIEKDYMLYLETIIQDEHLTQKEKKKYNMMKASKLTEKNNIYYNLFLKEISSIILIDNNNYNKIIYTTPNFPILYNYSPKELINFTINDLIPPCIAEFHKELIDNTIKYSSLTHFFNKKPKNFIIKSKANNLYMINMYIKCIPNLSYGLIYIALIEKLKTNQFLIILDDEFKINSMSDPLSLVANSSTISNDAISYGLTSNLIGHHIGLIIPEILKYLRYSNDKFSFSKNDIDIKSNLYCNIYNFTDDEYMINLILDKIKECGTLVLDENNNSQGTQILKKFETNKYKNETNILEYNKFVLNMKQRLAEKTFSIFYRLISKNFINGKYTYYRIYISNDLLGSNENIEKTGREIENSIAGNDYTTGIANDTNIFKIPQSILKKERVIKIKIADEEKYQLKKKEKSEDKNNKENHHEKMMNNINKILTHNSHHFFKDSNINNNENENLNDNNNDIPKSNNSFMTKGSVDSVSFNKLKNRILEKNETYHIKYLRIFSLLFLFISLILINFNIKSLNENFKDLLMFLDGNYFFNHTKIIVTNIFITSINLRFLKLGIIIEDYEKEWTTSIFSKLIDQLSEEIGKMAYFESEYENKLNQIEYMNIYIYDMNTLSEIALDGANLLSLILSNGIRLRANLDRYIYNDISQTFEVYCENIINCTYVYLNNNNINGLDVETKLKIVKSGKYNYNVIYLVINVTFFCIILSIFILLVRKLFLIEKYFLKKLIKFKTYNFDIYLQYLDDLKKKLKKSSIDDDKNEETFNESNENNYEDINDIKSLSPISKYIRKKTNDNKFKKNDKKEKNNEIVEQNNQKKKKHKGKKISKIQQQKREKIEIMLQYFIIYNIFFCIKACGIIFLIITNYLIISILYSYRREKFFELDNIMNEIIGIYKDDFYIYSIIKRELLNYELFKNLKIEYINQLENNIIENITIYNKTYTKDTINELNEINYLYNIELMNKTKIKTFETILMLLTSNNLDKKSYNEINLLYNGDVCEFLFSENETTLTTCYSFWSSILKQGIEPSTTQFRIDLDNFIIHLHQINNNNLEVGINPKVIYFLEIYITYYFMGGLEKTIKIFDNIRNSQINHLINYLQFIFIFYFILGILLIIPLNIILFYAKENFNSFLNFIGILPIQYLSEDEKFYKDTLKLEGDIFN